MEEKNSERQEERWWGYYDGGVREEGRRVGGVRKLRRIKWSFAKAGSANSNL